MWSRFWAYDEPELKQLITDFKKHEVPLSVCIIDMDWHTGKNPYHKGWTGYTWDNDLFPNPPAMLRWLHQNKLKTSLNLHPADGVAPHEKAYPVMAKKLGLTILTENQFLNQYGNGKN